MKLHDLVSELQRLDPSIEVSVEENEDSANAGISKSTRQFAFSEDGAIVVVIVNYLKIKPVKR